MAAVTTNYGFDVPTSSDLVKNGATAISTLGQDLDTFLFRPFSKNAVINGAMDIWQRGTSVSVAANVLVYTADRWQVYNGVNQAMTVSRQATGDTTNLPFIQYCARVQRNSGQTGTTETFFTQPLESTNSIPLAGRSVTVSFYARRGANYSPTSNNLKVNLVSGTGTDQNITTYTGGASVATVTNALTTTWTRYTVTGTVGATATELRVDFAWTPTGTAGAADFFEVTGIQLEDGSQATPFSRMAGTLQGELAACQRYFEVVLNDTVSGVFYSTSAAYCIAKFNVPKRSSGSLTITYPTTLTNGLYEIATAFRTPTALANEAFGVDQIGFTATGMSSGTIGKSLRGTFGVQITANAEL
jgi:hypothetical protein